LAASFSTAMKIGVLEAETLWVNCVLEPILTHTRVHTVLIYATHRMAFLPKRVALSDMARWAHVAFEYSMNAKRVSCVGSPASTRCLISPQLEK
jgi:hypothetical protein